LSGLPDQQRRDAKGPEAVQAEQKSLREQRDELTAQIAAREAAKEAS
jgi:hypothetical protein